MSVITELIIWSSPIVLGLCIWLFKELYDSFKGDLGDLKKSNAAIRTEQATFKVTLTNIDAKVEKLDKKVDTLSGITNALDKRSGDTVTLTTSIKTLERKLDEHESNYGKVIILLKKVTEKLWPSSKTGA